jgi:MFS family permease
MTHHRADCICQGCFLLLFGRLADLYGRKKVFILGSLWLAVFSLGLGFANGIIVFSPILPSCLGSYMADEITIDVLRGFQGIGAAATIPSAVPSFSLNLTQQIFTFLALQVGILAHAFPPSRMRSIAFSTFSAGAPTGGAVGMILGGVLTQESKYVNLEQCSSISIHEIISQENVAFYILLGNRS